MGIFLEAGAHVTGAQETDADADGLRGADDLMRELVGVGVGVAAGIVVEVVELADEGDAGGEHLEEGGAGYVVEILG